MFKAKPTKEIMDKYPKKIISRAQRPFGSTWKKQVDEKDIKIFEKYQFRIKIWYLSIVIPFLLFFIYSIIDSISEINAIKTRLNVLEGLKKK